jgi:hypothetical protein
MDADQAASEAARALAQRRWGVTPAEKRERRRADLLDELVRLDQAELAEQRVRTETEA